MSAVAFIDFPNFHSSLRNSPAKFGNLDFHTHLEILISCLHDLASPGPLIRTVCYGRHQEVNRYRESDFYRLGIDWEWVPGTQKELTDSFLLVGAVELIENGNLQHLILVSGDQDFIALLEHARKRGIRTSVVAPAPENCGFLVSQYANRLVFFTDYLKRKRRFRTAAKIDQIKPVLEQCLAQRGEANLDAVVATVIWDCEHRDRRFEDPKEVRAFLRQHACGLGIEIIQAENKIRTRMGVDEDEIHSPRNYAKILESEDPYVVIVGTDHWDVLSELIYNQLARKPQTLDQLRENIVIMTGTGINPIVFQPRLEEVIRELTLSEAIVTAKKSKQDDSPRYRIPSCCESYEAFIDIVTKWWLSLLAKRLKQQHPGQEVQFEALARLFDCYDEEDRRNKLLACFEDVMAKGASA